MPSMLTFDAFGRLLCGFRGRISRSWYWSGLASIFGVLLLLWFVGDQLPSLSGVPEALRFPLSLAFFWAVTFIPLSAISVKRLHDRDKTGWWVVPFLLVPYWLDKLSGRVPEESALWWAAVGIGAALSLWGLIEIGVLKGTAGGNRYGDDPLATERSSAVPSA